MKRNKIPITLFLIAIICSKAWECAGQEKAATGQYDYYSLALTSLSDSAAEARKLPDISERVKLLIYAARISAPAQHGEAVRILDVALSELKASDSDDQTSWKRRHTTATLRNEVLGLYAVLEPERAIAIQKELQAQAESRAESKATSPKIDTSFTEFSNRRTTADQATKLALSLLHINPERAFTLVLQSLQNGIVSGVLVEIVQELLRSEKRAFLSRLEIAVGEVLATKTTLDPVSLAFSGAFLQSDKEMPLLVSRAFVSFFMNSLQSWSNFVRESSANGGLDSSYINASFGMFSLNVRPVLLQYAPRQLPVFDSVMDQLGPLIPASSRSNMQAFQPETLSDPRDKLADILKDPAPEKRDLRLVRLISQILKDESGQSSDTFELAADVISGFTDTEAKTSFANLLTIMRMDALAKEQKFVEAQELASKISSEEMRAWSLLALSAVTAKADRVLGFEALSKALKILDNVSASPNKVELALSAAAMLAKADGERAFDAFSAASRYANSSPSKVEPPETPPFAFGLEVKIGERHASLGVFPRSLSELRIDPALSELAKQDWFRADRIVDDIREPSLRLQLKLQFAEAMLAQELKHRQTDKPAAKKLTTGPMCTQ